VRLIRRVASLEARNQPSIPFTVVIVETGQDEAGARAAHEAVNGPIDPRGLAVLIQRFG
jgi:hypothetical protein